MTEGTSNSYLYVNNINDYSSSMILTQNAPSFYVTLYKTTGEAGDFYMTIGDGNERLGSLYIPCYLPIAFKTNSTAIPTSFVVESGILYAYLEIVGYTPVIVPGYSWYCLNLCTSCTEIVNYKVPVGHVYFSGIHFVTPMTTLNVTQSMVQFVTLAGEPVTWEEAVCSCAPPSAEFITAVIFIIVMAFVFRF